MEFNEYLRIVRKWWWLFVLSVAVLGGLSYLRISRQPYVYSSQVLMLVGSFIDSPNPSTSEISVGGQLARTYAVLATTNNILGAVVENLDLPPNANFNVSARTGGETPLVIISAEYSDPELTAAIANEVAQQLIQNSPTTLTAEEQKTLSDIQLEIDALNEQQRFSRDRLRIVDDQLVESGNSPYITDLLEVQRNRLVEQINTSSDNLSSFHNIAASIQARVNSLTILEKAHIPGSPIGPNVLFTTLFGCAIGLVLSVGGVLVLEYLDDTIKTPGEITRTLAYPVLGAVSRVGPFRGSSADCLVAYLHPQSTAAESYRALRTNLLFSNPSDTQSYIITSLGTREGKSTTAANLAVTLASARLRVLLIDANLHNPALHKFFGLSNEIGLTTLLSAEPPDTFDALMENESFRDCLQETNTRGLYLLSSGFLPPNPGDLLGSGTMQRWYNLFLSTPEIDVVIFDTPPALAVSDTMVLAAATGAPVILVLRPGKTRRNVALRARDQFAQLDIDVRGIFLNRIRSQMLYQDYGYYSSVAETIPNRQTLNLARLNERVDRTEVD